MLERCWRGIQPDRPEYDNIVVVVVVVVVVVMVMMMMMMMMPPTDTHVPSHHCGGQQNSKDGQRWVRHSHTLSASTNNTSTERND